MRAAVVGLGWWGKVIVKNLAKSDKINVCLFVWSNIPFVESIKIIPTSELDAPVAIFLVYSWCPGVSAIINLHLSVSKYL